MGTRSSESHWDGVARTVYDERGIITRPQDDLVAVASLGHFGSLRGRRILDLGCGLGESSLMFAQDCAEVVSVDMSEQAIEILQEHCKLNGITNLRAECMSAFDIDTLGQFDLVFGSYVLHHLEPFDEFCKILRSAIVPGGRGFFMENNAMSDVLIWCRDHLVGRYGIPRFGDDVEFPLTPSEVKTLGNYFDVQAEYPEFLFARMATRYLFKDKGMSTAKRVDEYLYRFPSVRKYSYRQFLYLS